MHQIGGFKHGNYKINDCFELLSMVTYADKLKSLIKRNFQLVEEFLY